MTDPREQSIIKLTDELLALARAKQKERHPLQEVAIDAAFIFRFDRIAVSMLKEIRAMLRSIIRQNSKLSMNDDKELGSPFDQEDGWKLYLHLEHHIGLKVVNDLQMAFPTWRFTHPKDWGYQRYGSPSSIRAIVMSENQVNIEHWALIGEALHTVQIAEKINRLATRFGLWPEKEELDYHAPVALKSMWQSVVRWILFDEPTPVFYRAVTRTLIRGLFAGFWQTRVRRFPTRVRKDMHAAIRSPLCQNATNATPRTWGIHAPRCVNDIGQWGSHDRVLRHDPLATVRNTLRTPN